MPTPSNHVDHINKLIELIKANQAVSLVCLNDYGLYSNFDLFVYPCEFNQGTTNSLKALIKRTIANYVKENPDAEGMHLRKVFAPGKKVVMRHGEKEIVRERDYYSVDIDFHIYDGGTNTFNYKMKCQEEARTG